MRYLFLLLVFATTVYAVIDCVRTEGSQVRNLPKALWLIVIVLVWVIGPVAWLVAGRDRGRASASPARPGPLAPDDDPTFLHQLDLERRRREQEQQPDGDREPPEGDEATGVR